jgi:hypothetical protein
MILSHRMLPSSQPSPCAVLNLDRVGIVFLSSNIALFSMPGALPLGTVMRNASFDFCAEGDPAGQRRKDTLPALAPDSFYRSMVFAAALAPQARHEQLLEVHQQVLEGYLAGLTHISSERAAVQVPGDGRTLAQVVGHILEWDRALLIAFGEILAGVRWPRIMTKSINIDPDGESHEFESENSFNSFYATRQLSEPWVNIRARAIEAAHALHAAFTAPGLLTPERLEATRIYSGFRLPTGETLDMPCGWYLWMTALEHEGIDHVDALMAGSIG